HTNCRAGPRPARLSSLMQADYSSSPSATRIKSTRTRTTPSKLSKVCSIAFSALRAFAVRAGSFCHEVPVRFPMSDHTPSPHPARESIQIGLRWQSHERTADVPLPPAQSSLLDLLPPARALAHAATAMAIDQVRSEGKEISCRAGCGACCRQLVAISVVEALAVAETVDALPPERQAAIRGRFEAAVSRLEEAGLLDR